MLLRPLQLQVSAGPLDGFEQYMLLSLTDRFYYISSVCSPRYQLPL